MKYRLKKDLPDYKAGEIFEFDGVSLYKAQTLDEKNTPGQWPMRYVENNPEWFEPIEDRIEAEIW